MSDRGLMSGATPLFRRPRTTGQLANRDWPCFLALAEGAFERRWLTNHGPLVDELEGRLAAFHGVAHCIAVANACFGLLLAIESLAVPGRRKVLLPSLTFRGLPHVIRWAGLEPVYVDVDPHTHCLQPQQLADRIGPDTAAILAVDNVNALCDIDAIEAAAAVAGVPVILDSVYAMGGSYKGGDPVGSRGRVTAFSLHATKLLGGFEGGYLTTDDSDLAAALRRKRTFGFGAAGFPEELGLNAKLNEIHAALALSNLPFVGDIVADNQRRLTAYREALCQVPWLTVADYSRGPGNAGLVLVGVEADAPVSRDELVLILRSENALVRPYYWPPLHRADPSHDGRSLPATDEIAARFLQMPCGDRMGLDDVERLCGFIASLDGMRDVAMGRYG